MATSPVSLNGNGSSSSISVDVLAERIRLASGSRWVRLGRKLGIGPKFA